VRNKSSHAARFMARKKSRTHHNVVVRVLPSDPGNSLWFPLAMCRGAGRQLIRWSNKNNESYIGISATFCRFVEHFKKAARK